MDPEDMLTQVFLELPERVEKLENALWEHMTLIAMLLSRSGLSQEKIDQAFELASCDLIGNHPSQLDIFQSCENVKGWHVQRSLGGGPQVSFLPLSLDLPLVNLVNVAPERAARMPRIVVILQNYLEPWLLRLIICPSPGTGFRNRFDLMT
jgi:hypothetical protein